MKYLGLLLSGIADEPLEILDGKTPLEAADTPNLDAWGQHAVSGRLGPIPDRLWPDAEYSVFGSLGYDAEKEYPGRAAVLAAEIGVEPAPGRHFWAFRFVTVSESRIIDETAGSISHREAQVLTEGLNRHFHSDGIRFVTGPGGTHLAEVPESAWPQDTMAERMCPPSVMVQKSWREGIPRHFLQTGWETFLTKAAQFLENHEVNKVRIDLGENPANFIWLWGSYGPSGDLGFEKRFGLRPSVLATPVFSPGLGRLLGLDWNPLKEIQEPVELKALAELLGQQLEARDFVWLLISPTDRVSREGDYKQKIRWIEAMDRYLVAPFAVRPELRLGVFSAHVHSSAKRRITRTAAPFWMSAEKPGAPALITEEAAASGPPIPLGSTVIRSFLKTDNVR
ncbi:MAG: hypothetical protein HQL11_04760, partial [Candidatus Omnitrophica bacterium]|nr:hypothetical protein [Candidatus Omnitrophota bacterium]